jgi:hypothetical protein
VYIFKQFSECTVQIANKMGFQQKYVRIFLLHAKY